MRLLIAVLVLLLAPAVASAQSDPVPTRIESYRQVGGKGLEARIFLPSKPRRSAPAMLLFHGGGWVAGEASWTDAAARRFADRGIVAISIEYRLSGPSATPLDAFGDACDAFVWAHANARRLGVDPKRIGGYGVSAGGQLAALMGVAACLGPDDHVVFPALLVLRSPALDLAEDSYFNRLLRGYPASPLSPLSEAPGMVPTLIIQGDADTLTPARAAIDFCRATVKAGVVCEVDLHAGVGHLLTRNLKDQEDNYDPDPAAVRDSWARTFTFLGRQGWGK